MLQRCLILLQDHLTFRKVFKYSIFISNAITECSIPLTLTSAFYQHNVDLKNYYFKLLISGVAKSIVRVVRVVHLLLRTSYLFHLTCPWTSEKTFS